MSYRVTTNLLEFSLRVAPAGGHDAALIDASQVLARSHLAALKVLQLTKALVERALEAEMEAHLGHAKHEAITNPAKNDMIFRAGNPNSF